MNRVEKVIDKFKPVFNGSIPKMSEEMEIHRSTLHHAVRRGVFSTKLQKKFLDLSKKHEIDLKPEEVLNV